MKIQNENPQSTASTQAQRPSELTSSSKQASVSGRVGNAEEDRLEISSFADQVSAATEAHVTQRTERVKELTALYQSGRYEVDTSKLSQALVNSAIATKRPGE
ncbi:MAG: flagellar biosynthesis anti-sigma factor FlgM [Bryobacteraceae bacterium]